MGLIQDILDIDVPYNPKLSPDGKRVVYQTSLKWHHRKGEHNVAPLWIAETGVEKSARKLTDGDYNDRMPQWAPDGKSIVFFSDRAKKGKACALYLWNPDEDISKAKAITPAESEVRFDKFGFSPDGQYIAFVAPHEKSAEKKAKQEAKDDARVWGEDWDYSYLQLLDVEKGDIKVISPSNLHVNDFAWSDDGAEIAIATHQTPHIESANLHGTEISIIDIATQTARNVAHVAGDILDLTWLDSDLYFRSSNVPNQDLSGYAVYSVHLADKSGEVKKAAAGVENCAMGLAKAAGKLIVYIEHGLEDELQFLNGRVLLRQKTWIKSFDAAREDTNELVLTVSDGDVNHPTEVFSIAPSGERTQLSNHGEVFAAREFGAATFIECQTLDGKERLDGIYLTPKQHAGPDGRPKQPLPTMVCIHGGPYYRAADTFDSFGPTHLIAPLLLDEGYGLLLPNYRGSSGRGERFASYSRGGLGIYDEPDIVATTQHAIEHGYADKTNLMAMGWSQGGHLSYLSAVRNGAHKFGWRYKAIIPGAGITDWDTMTLTSDIGYSQANISGGEMWKLDKSDVRTRSGSAIWEFKEAAEQGRIPPVLMLHGEQDVRVPVSQSWGFRRALDRAGLPFELVTYPREGHQFKERKHIEDLMGRVLEYTKKHIS